MAMSRRAKKRVVILIVAVAGLAITVGSAWTLRKAGKARAIERARVEGLESFERQDYVRATDQLGRYVNTNRDDGEMILKFVEARRRAPQVNARHLITAATFAELAATKMPGDVRPLEQLLSLYSEMGFLTEYLETADKILAIDPNNQEALIARVTGLAAKGDVSQAIDAAKVMSDRHESDWRAHAATIDLMRQRGDSPEAVLAYINGVADVFIEDINVAIQQARASILARNEPAARAAMDRAVALQIPDAETLGRLVSLLDGLNEREKANEIIAREVDRLGDPARVVAIDRAWKDGRARDSIDLVVAATSGREASELSTDLLGWGALMASTSDEASDQELAALLSAELSERPGDEAQSWLALMEAREHLEAGDIVAARERLEFVKSVDQSTLADFMLGQAELRVGDRRGAIARWRGVIEREPRWIAARLSLATALLEDGEIREAHGAAIETLRLAPNRLLVAQLFARTTAALADADMPDAQSTAVAIDALGRIIEDGQMAPGPSLALMARLKAADGDLEGAQEIVDRILRERPELSAGDALALAAAIDRRKLTGAEQLLSGATGIANDPSVMLARALKSAADGRSDEGKALLRDGLASAPAANKEPFARAHAQYLDSINDPGALDAMRSLSHGYSASPAAQVDVLRSRVAWTDQALVGQAVGNLRAAVGEQSPAWRIYEARRLLTFFPESTARSGGDPRTANAAEVVLMLSNVVRTDPGDVQAAMLLAEANLIMNDRVPAINALSAAATANPGEPAVYPRLISLLQEQGDTAAAEIRLNEFLRIRDLPPALQRARVDLLLAQGMAAEAVPELEQLAQSGDPDDLARLATQYGRQGRRAEATRLFEELETIDNPTVGSVLAVAEYRLAMGQPDRALAAIDRLPESVAEGRRMLIRADLLERAGRDDAATELFKRAAETQDSGEAWLALARHYVRQNQPSEAKAAIDRAFAVAPNDPAIRSLAKGLALATGQPAPEGLESVALAARANAEMRMLATIQMLRDDPTAGEEYLKQVRDTIADYPRYFPARRLLIMAYAERGEWDAAVDAAREAARVLPIDAQPAQLLTEVYAARAMYEGNRGLQEAQKQLTEQALAAAREWRARSLGDPFDADVAIADLQDRLNNPREGLRLLEPYSERLAQAGMLVAPLRARMHAKLGQVDRAEAVLLPMAQSEEEWAVLHAETARHLTNDPAQVRAWLGRSESFVGESVRGRLTLAQAWYDLGIRSKQDSDHVEAARIIESVSPQDRAGAGALLLGTIYELLDRPADAERVYRESLAVIPEEPITLNNLSYLLTSQGIKLDEAIELAELAVENSKKFGFPPSQRVNFIDSLGEALTKAGRFDEAAAMYRSGLALEPTNRMLMMGLTESLLGSGNVDEARRWLTQLAQTAPVRVADDPLHSRLREANARLNSGR